MVYPSRRGRSRGHATLAAASVLLPINKRANGAFFTRQRRAGRHAGRWKNYTSDFPLIVPSPIAAPQGIVKALDWLKT